MLENGSWVCNSKKKIALIIILLQILLVCLFVTPKVHYDQLTSLIPIQKYFVHENASELCRSMTEKAVYAAEEETVEQIITTEQPKIAVKEIIDSYTATNTYWVEHIRGFCSLYKEKLTRFSSSQMLKQGLPKWVWMVFNYHHLFYCATPKCSSTTWKTYIMDDSKVEWRGDIHE